MSPLETESDTARGQSREKVQSLTDRFVRAAEPADVTVLIVTYNNVEHIDRLIESLRSEAGSTRLRIVVADNASTDGTLQTVRRHTDVIAVDAGGNLGYAGGINVAARFAGSSEALLILNPDLWVQPGSVRRLLACRDRTGAGAVVPQILDADGATYSSLRREPTIVRALGDAAVGSRLPMRPPAFSEIVADPAEYSYSHRVDWATGAAILVNGEVARGVGDWDERFFLYSEETDYFRRIRDAGFEVWYEPAAVVHHSQGGSGSSSDLDSLLTINRIRYMRKYHDGFTAGVYRAAVALHELARSYKPAHRSALRHVLTESSWSELPGSRRSVVAGSLKSASGAVIIPAHNEAAVIGRTLSSLGELVQITDLDVIVAANGCSDDTASRARRVGGVEVIEIAEPSKTAALNRADQSTHRWPRLYLDADVEITPRAVVDTLNALRDGSALAARPPYLWNLQGASWVVRRYYGARSRLPSLRTRLWGAGVYGLSERGRSRFDTFPALTADDLYVDQMFADDERRIVATDPVKVHVPRTTRALLGVLRRQSRGTYELGSATRSSTARELVSGIRGPVSFVEACVYTSLSLLSRTSRRRGAQWERDDSSRLDSPQGQEPER